MKRLRREIEVHATGGDAYVARTRAEQLVHTRRDFKRISEEHRHVSQFLAMYEAQGGGVTLDHALVGMNRIMEVRAAKMSPTLYAKLTQSHRELSKALQRQGPTIQFYDARPDEQALDERNDMGGIDEDVRAVFAEMHLETLMPAPRDEPVSNNNAVPAVRQAAVAAVASSFAPAPVLNMRADGDDGGDNEDGGGDDVMDELTRRLGALRETV